MPACRRNDRSYERGIEMNKRNGTIAGLLLLAVLMLMVFFPSRAEAATVIYVRKGVTGYINFQNSPVPNCKWKVNKSSILKLKSSTATKAVYTGKKVGKAVLTAYNKYNTSQKYDIIVYVMPSGKLNKIDFQLYGSCLSQLGVAEGANFIDDSANRTSNFNWFRIFCNASITKNNSSRVFQTARTAKLLDPYSRITTLYGKSTLKTYRFSSDRFAKHLKARASGTYNIFKPFARNNVKYYMDYKYGKNYMLRFLFNRNREVTGFLYFWNYNKLPVR